LLSHDDARPPCARFGAAAPRRRRAARAQQAASSRTEHRMTRRTSLVERSYRSALLIFPPKFRAQFADEMVDFARHRMRAARREGVAACARETARLFADLALSAPREWITHTREQRAARAASIAAGILPRDNMDIFIQDLRFALRGLTRRPAFT